ncbi:hypothetical protein BO71DRAFT_489013 [Aspergillus ellipticus CBS 707.79]|uniref:Uncharacterized protein n=1 Tax=Aspergillus ellipticus CBS 707.79 TaxID=1448320 RepID=A0A319CU75_9EURO|nr:hypothetical protein BO71DRAFT_489013 [Aspergillus ellipticus CBS 707.79]
MTRTTDILEPIAVVGMSIKLPEDGDTPEGFWRMMEEKRCAMKEWPADKMNLEAFNYRDSKNFIPGAHLMKEDCALFDTAFFGISGTEAQAMDPQNRLLLEAAYRALENAGIPMEQANGTKTGVYTGCMAHDYKHMISHDADHVPKYAAIGSNLSMLANRLSWYFNFHGPSISLDTACSSGLVALDLACQSLRDKDSDMALVTGSNIVLAVEPLLSLMNMGFCSPDGRSFSFDARANGYGRGEGVGVLVIKRLKDAVQDGNIIRAVIRSTGSNQDGYTPGVTQPNKDSQTRLIRDTYAKAGLDLGQTRFFEAHGTGTAIGDPIEAGAIGDAFGPLRSPEDPLYVGAVKSNIGHLEGCSGIAAVVKAIMVLEKGLIPPNTNFETLNPDIDAEFLNLKFPTELSPWPSRGLRRASVASFGFGGSNAHAVLDDAYHFLQERGLHGSHCSVRDPPGLPTVNGILNGLPNATNGVCKSETGDAENALSSQLLVWSTDDEAGIKRMTDAYTQFFQARSLSAPEEGAFLPRLANTLAFKRSQLQWRAFSVAKSMGDMGNLESITSSPFRVQKNPGLGFIFTGQGAQYYQMGAELVNYPVFRHTMDLCEHALQEFGCPWSIFDMLARADTSFDINEPEYAQPLTTALQLSLVELLASFDLNPSMVLGHSSGEIAAAYTVGGLSLQSACKVSYFRGLCASKLKKSSCDGAMLAVDLSQSAAEAYLGRVRAQVTAKNIQVACINSPKNVTISGDGVAIDHLKSILDGESIVSHRLRTGVAYHSSQMNAVASEYEAALTDLTPGPRSSKAVMISSVLGEEVTDLSLLVAPSYWVQNMVSPVLFSAALSTALSQSQFSAKNKRLGTRARQAIADWIELGPHSALKRPFREVLAAGMGAGRRREVRYTAALDRNTPPVQALQAAVGHMYAQGHAVALDQVNQPDRHAVGFETTLVNLPEYPFNHSKRYWFERPTTRRLRLRSHRKLELLGVPAPESTPSEAKWRKIFDCSEMPWLLDHAVSGKPIYPATGMLVMAIEGLRQLADPSRSISGYFIHDASFVHPISISTVQTTEVQLYMRPARQVMDQSSHAYEFQIYTESGDRLDINCRGLVSVQYATQAATEHSQITHHHSAQEIEHYQNRFQEALKDCSTVVPKDMLYKTLATNGMNYGPSFQLLDQVQWDGSKTAVAQIKTFAWTKEHSQHARDEHVIHPATLDNFGHLAWVSLTQGGRETITTGVVFSRVRGAWISGAGAAAPAVNALTAYSHTRFRGLRGAETSAFALDEAGNPRLWISSMETTSITPNNPRYQEPEPRDLCYNLEWVPPAPLSTAAHDQIPSERVITIIIDPRSQLQTRLARLTAALLPGSEVLIHPIVDLPSIRVAEHNPFLVFLPEVEQSLLVEMGEDMFTQLQHIFTRAQNIVWISAARRGSPRWPAAHAAQGLARVLCTENGRLGFITAQLEDGPGDNDPVTAWAQHIHEIIARWFSSASDQPRDFDYQERNGTLHVARVGEDRHLSEQISEQVEAPAKLRPFGQTGRPLAMAITNPGSLDASGAVYMEDPNYTRSLEPNEIEIHNKAIGVNLRDVFTLLGRIKDETQLGCECAGIVTRVGSACTTLQPGDRVTALKLGCSSSFARFDARMAAKIPNDMSWATAAAIPITAVTAYHSLIRLGQLSRGESILIHSGAGGTGQIAVQLALHIGARVFVTVSSEDKRQLLRDQYQIPDSQILFSRDTSFQRHIMRLTDNRGVDVVLNSLAGDGLVASWECVAPYGRFIEIGKTDVENNTRLPMINFARNVSFFVVAVDQWTERPDLVQASLAPVMEMVAAGTLRPAWPLREYSIADTEAALRSMQSGKNVGKYVLTMDDNALVRTSLRHIPSYTLSPDATYVIAGGLGGLGRSAASWMASMGARHLLLLSRSGPKSAAAQALIQTLQAQGVQVRTPKCDVTSLDALRTAIGDCAAANWPPIRGCLQGTMVLQDTIFEKLTFPQWDTSLQAKVRSTENLHALLPPNLDFFILLSSLSGIIGNISQANYAAGNTFQDAFAAYRHSLGQRAIALNLGWMADVGVAAENQDHYTRVQQRVPGMTQIRESEFLALLEVCCNPSTSPNKNQLLIGLTTPANLALEGIDPPAWVTSRALFQDLPKQDPNTTPSSSSSNNSSIPSDWQIAYRRADSAATAMDIVTAGLTQKLARALAIPPGEIDMQRSLALQGVDSLLAVELRHWISRAFVADVSALDITSAAHLEDLAALVVGRSDVKFSD